MFFTDAKAIIIMNRFWVKNIFLISYLLSLISLILLPNFCFAKYTASNISDFVSKTNQGVGAETIDYKTFTAKIVQAGLGVVGLVFFILIFYGGYLWLTSGGKEEAIKKARDTVVASIIGLMIIIGSYALTNLVFKRLVGGKTPDAPLTSGQAGGGDKTKPQGCCLDDARAPGTYLSQVGSQYHMLWSITDADTCKEIGNTKSDEDEVAGEGHWQFIPDVDNYDICGEAARTQEDKLGI